MKKITFWLFCAVAVASPLCEGWNGGAAAEPSLAVAQPFTYAENIVPDDPGWDVGPTLFQTSDGNITMVWTGGAPGSNESSAVNLWKSTSLDDGRTWNRAEVFLQDEPRGLFNPVSVVLPNDDVLLFYQPYLYPYDEPVNLLRSQDGGKTWSRPRKIDTGHGYCSLRSQPVLLRRGTLLLPFCYEESTSRGEEAELWTGSCMISCDNGQNWTKGGDMMHWDKPRGAQEPTVVELSDGRLYALLRTNQGVQYECYSSDEGITWTKPAPSRFQSPCACAILYRLASGRIIVVWDHVSSNVNLPRSPMDIASTIDDGKTWRVRRLHAAEHQLSNHGVLQLRNSDILVAIGSAGPISMARLTEEWISSNEAVDLPSRGQ